jgi:hypothetical protein
VSSRNWTRGSKKCGNALFAVAAFIGFFATVSAGARQVDQARAEQYFKEAAALCEREGGRLWGVSLCGPMVIADAATKTIAANQPMPADKRPPALGFANAALDWGGTRWSTFVWQFIPNDERRRGVLWLHELFHRVQPGLGLLFNEPDNSHLDTIVGRYWLQLEWRALAKALASTSNDRTAAIADALAFRERRRSAFRDAAQNERVLELQEGLAQYTGTVGSSTSAAEATKLAIMQLEEAPVGESFIRNFAYPTGAAYGVLLDALAPGWTRRLKPTDDLGQLVKTASQTATLPDPEVQERHYGGEELRASEKKRTEDRLALLSDLRRRFVEGPRLIIPRSRNATFSNAGMIPIADAGTIYPNYRTDTEWGSLVAERVLMSTDRSTIAVPAPESMTGSELKGHGWTLKLAPGWVIRPGTRAGDFVVVQEGK